MFRHIASFEFRYQLRSPVFWVGFVLFFLLTFGSVTVDQIQIGSRGNVNVNSPFAILQTLSIMNLFLVFVIVAVVANVVIRDDETGFAPILRSTPVTKAAYLLGRFTGACVAAFLVMAAIPLAIAVGAVMPWLDSEKVGPFHPVDYLYALFLFGLPTLLIISATFFALATVTRSMMWTYVGAVSLIVLYFVTRGLLRDPRHDSIAALTDPFGLSALSITTKYWTASERNTRLPALTGLLLANRVIWSLVAAGIFTVGCRLFRFESRGLTAGARPRAEAGPDVALPAVQFGFLPTPRADAATRWAQLWQLARFDMLFVFRSPAFFVLLGIGILNSGGALWFSGEFYGSPSYPVTRLMVSALNGAFTIMPIIIAVFYAGELVWRDRDRRMHEIIDATAAPDWTHLLPKILAITLVLASTATVAVLTAMLVQLLKGYTHFEVVAYALWFALPMTITAVLLAVLSVFVQVLVPQKFIGWGVMLVYLVASVALVTAGFEHNLYNYGSWPTPPLSDMNGQGRFWIGMAWFQLYWGALALVLVMLSYALWRRGVTLELRPRLRQIPQRLRGWALVPLAIGLITWLGSGIFIYHNTNQLNHYITAPQREARLARAEKDLLAFERLPQPRVTGVTLDVQLFPRDARAVTRGSFVLQNRSAVPIEELHLRGTELLKLDTVEFPGATLKKEYTEHNYRIYALQPALQPGEKRTLKFVTTLEERGFPNANPLTRIVANGTFLDNGEISPGIGMARDALLVDRAKRRKYGLPPDLRPPTLEDESGRTRNAFTPDSDWVDADITITTDADQTPIAPGYTVSDTTAEGRRTVHFKTDAPINHFFSIQSARYEVRRDKWNAVDLAVYYHPGHEYNVDRMLSAMKTSLAIFSSKFSPYQFRQARILEFPAYQDFAQSFANTIPYSESIGFITHLTDTNKIDMITYVTAHEMGHQWWGHQLVSSFQQGQTMLIESFAQYSALLVMEQLYGREQIRRFLKYELDRYLRSRGGEVLEELPLARVENQAYIHYQKGALVMYWLKEVVGEDVVDRSMARMLKQYAFKAAPYPNTRDFLNILREEAGPQHDALITDLFEKITLLDVKATAAHATKLANGRYELSLEIEAHKFYADGKGKETEAPLNETIDIGAFSSEPGQSGFNPESVLSFDRRTVYTGKQTITLTLNQEPKWAGIDPYNKRIDRNSDDNLKQVVIQ